MGAGQRVFTAVVRQRHGHRAGAVVDGAAQRALAGAVACHFTGAVGQLGGPAGQRRRGVDHRVVHAGVGHHQVGGLACQAVAERVGHVAQHLVVRRVLAAGADAAQRAAAQRHVGLAAEGQPALPGSAAVDADAAFQNKAGRQAVAQVFGALEAQARTGSQAAADLGGGAVAAAFDHQAGVGHAVHRDGGLRLRGAAGQGQQGSGNAVFHKVSFDCYRYGYGQAART
jgi:hypothetical protein